MSKIAPPRPTRCWRKKTGPGEVILIASAIAPKSGASRNRPSAAAETSKARLRNTDDLGLDRRDCAELLANACGLLAGSEHEDPLRWRHVQCDAARYRARRAQGDELDGGEHQQRRLGDRTR